jgi:hypothetical protein
MKRTIISGWIAAGLLLGGMTLPTLSGNGCGYGGPPKSDKERAARQAACLENGGVCAKGGPRANCPGLGQGKGQRRGACDGTGPRAGTGNCPVNGSGQTQK